jgi:Cupin
MNPPWALHIRDEAPLSLVAMLRGSACFVIDGHEPVWLDSGDVAILLGPDHYLFADDPATSPQAIIHPGQRCTTPDGREIPQMRSFGVRRWGNAADGVTEVLTGTYNFEGEVSRRLLDALPQQLVLRRDEWQTPVLGLLAAETLRDQAGQDAVLDRLLDLLLIDAVRTYLARAEQAAPGWYRAQRDPVVAQAVRLMQEARPRRGRSGRWPMRRGSRGRHSPGASPRSWASRRWSSSPNGG